MRAEALQYIDRIDAALALLRQSLDWDRALRRLDELNARVEDPTLWNDAKKAQDVMREMEATVDRAVLLANQMLMLAKIEQQRSHGPFERCHLDKLARAAVRETTLSRSLEVVAEADKTYFDRASEQLNRQASQIKKTLGVSVFDPKCIFWLI